MLQSEVAVPQNLVPKAPPEMPGAVSWAQVEALKEKEIKDSVMEERWKPLLVDSLDQWYRCFPVCSLYIYTLLIFTYKLNKTYEKIVYDKEY